MFCRCCKTEQPDSEFLPKKNGKIKKACKKCCDGFSEKTRTYNRTHPKKLYGGKSYESRNIILKEIGFNSYQEYLQSDLWKGIRQVIYAQKGSLCVLCNGQATELHHNRYHKNDLLGMRTLYINPICNSCHQSIEFRNGKKTSLEYAATAFRKLYRNKLREAKKLNPKPPKPKPIIDSRQRKGPDERQRDAFMAVVRRAKDGEIQILKKLRAAIDQEIRRTNDIKSLIGIADYLASRWR